MTTDIYALKDENNRVRYIGKSSHSVSKRFSRHLADGRNGNSTHKACWIRGMQQRGLEPTVQIMETVDGDGLEQEVRWIAMMREMGAKMTNLTDGGDGVCGCKRTDEQKAKQSAALKEYYKTHTHPTKGRKLSEAQCKKQSERMKGHTNTPEARKNMSEARKGMKFTDEHKRNMSKARSGKPTGPRSAETRAKIAAGMAKAHAEGRAKRVDTDSTGRFVKAA